MRDEVPDRETDTEASMNHDNWLTEPIDAAQARHDDALIECARDCFTEACDNCQSQTQNHVDTCTAGVDPKISWHVVMHGEVVRAMFVCDDCAAKFDDEERLG